MFQFIFSMLFGAAVFAAGIIFEKMSAAENIKPCEGICENESEQDSKLRAQWQKLLEYNGDEQEEDL